MGLFNNLEQRLDRIVNGSFSKAFKAAVQPVEIAAALQNELDTHISKKANKSVVPNVFIVELASEDFVRLEPNLGTLVNELCTIITQHCIEQRYSPIDAPTVTIRSGEGLGTGDMRILSDSQLISSSQAIPKVEAALNDQTLVPPMTVVQFSPLITTTDGKTFAITKPETTIGRSSQADISVADPAISRLHCSILLGTSVARIKDLGSSNGTLVDGVKVDEIELYNGARISIGSHTLIYSSE